MPTVMSAQANISVALWKSSLIQFLVARRKVWLTSAAGVPCSDERKTWAQSEYYTWQNSVGGKTPRKCIHCVPAQGTAKHHAKSGWPPFSDVAAVTKPRRETRWNLLGCPKLANRSQPLVGRRSPYCEDIWKRYCYLTSFSDCRYMP